MKVNISRCKLAYSYFLEKAKEFENVITMSFSTPRYAYVFFPYPSTYDYKGRFVIYKRDNLNGDIYEIFLDFSDKKSAKKFFYSDNAIKKIKKIEKQKYIII